MKWSWVASLAEVKERRQHSQRLVGLQLVTVRYCEIAGEAVLAEASTAIWDVSRAGRWDRFIGHEISGVELHYRPWAPDDGYWCTRVTVTVCGTDIQFLGGQAEAGQTLAPSADDIAVLFPPARLPEWDRYDDGV